MDKTLWIFVLNSYPKDKSTAGFLKRIQDQIDNLPQIIKKCGMPLHREFINLTKDELYNKFNTLITESDYKNAKQLIFIFRGHGGELIESQAPAIASLDGETIFFHRIMLRFFKDVAKDIYMFVDMCRAPIEGVRLTENTSLPLNKGNFVLVHGVTRSMCGYGIFGKYLFDKIDLICNVDPNLEMILKFIKIIILNTKSDEQIVTSRIYVNDAVRTIYPELVKDIQTITVQDYGSIMATKIGLDLECRSVLYEISNHNHDPIICSVIIKKFVDNCRYNVENENILKSCIESAGIGLVGYIKKIKNFREETNLIKNKMRSFIYWNDLKTHVSLLLFIINALLYYQKEKNQKLLSILNEYTLIDSEIKNKLVPLSKKIDQDYQYLKFDKVVDSFLLMKESSIINENELKEINNLIEEYKAINLFRNNKDIFIYIRDFQYFNMLQDKLKKNNSPDNTLLDFLVRLEIIYMYYRKKYVESDRRDIDSLKKIIAYFQTVKMNQENLTNNEKKIVDNLIQEYIRRITL